jgi:2-dehydropantoate 2-reductase
MSETRPSLVSAEPVAQAQRVLVVGCGGIGGITAACLTETWSALGVEVVGYSTNAAIVESIRRHGYRLTGAEPARAVPGQCLSALTADVAPFDFIVLAVQPPQVEQADALAPQVSTPRGAQVLPEQQPVVQV